MPLHATSSGACHFKWRATSSGVCHFKWRMPLQVAHATSSGVSHREHATSCHFMPLQVACRTVSMPLHATSSGGRTVSMPLHATSCHFKWREVAWSGEIGLRTSCVLNVTLPPEKKKKKTKSDCHVWIPQMVWLDYVIRGSNRRIRTTVFVQPSSTYWDTSGHHSLGPLLREVTNSRGFLRPIKRHHSSSLAWKSTVGIQKNCQYYRVYNIQYQEMRVCVYTHIPFENMIEPGLSFLLKEAKCDHKRHVVWFWLDICRDPSMESGFETM